jgi:hypothetical protein
VYDENSRHHIRRLLVVTIYSLKVDIITYHRLDLSKIWNPFAKDKMQGLISQLACTNRELLLNIHDPGNPAVHASTSRILSQQLIIQTTVCPRKSLHTFVWKALDTNEGAPPDIGSQKDTPDCQLVLEPVHEQAQQGSDAFQGYLIYLEDEYKPLLDERSLFGYGTKYSDAPHKCNICRRTRYKVEEIKPLLEGVAEDGRIHTSRQGV